jgi:hypothetical protein
LLAALQVVLVVLLIARVDAPPCSLVARQS